MWRRRVLRWLAWPRGMMTLVSTAIKFHGNAWLVLALIQIFTLSYAPMFSISSTSSWRGWSIPKNSPRCASADVRLDGRRPAGQRVKRGPSSLAGYTGARVWLVVAAFTFFLPELEVPKSAENLSWHERLGLDALTLLKNRNIRVVFITTTLFNIPLAAFYPYAPTHLRDLGFTHTSAWMSLAQCSEVAAIFSLGWLLLHWRMKWIFAFGLGFGVLRFALCAVNTKTACSLASRCMARPSRSCSSPRRFISNSGWTRPGGRGRRRC